MLHPIFINSNEMQLRKVPDKSSSMTFAGRKPNIPGFLSKSEV